jgi:predicted nucleic acid-binding protein
VRIVVSDTSPVRALGHLGHISWLQLIFDSVIIPPAVAQELAQPPASLSPVDIHDFAFLRVQTPSNSDAVLALLSVLDLGEAEAITLAEEVHAEAVLIDERAGRQVARQRGIAVLGTLGILLRAKELRLCTEIRPLLDRLQMEINFFISPSLRAIILKRSGETEVSL